MNASRSRKSSGWFSVGSAAVGAFLFAVAAQLPAATFTVTNTSDSGAGSLRQAILDSNGINDMNVIQFAIPGSGVHTIALASPLPDITFPVTIDGYTQPGASPNTNPPGQGLNTVLQIEIDGAGVGAMPCMTVRAGNSTFLVMVIQGLVVNRCKGAAILVAAGGDSTVIRGNFIGTDPTGNVGYGAIDGDGIVVNLATGVVISGSNLISGNRDGIKILGSNTLVAGNLIGTNAAGTTAIGNLNGIEHQFGANVTIGGTTAPERNVISGNGLNVSIANGPDLIQGNYIGTDVSGTLIVGGGTGISVGVSIAGAIKANVIAGNNIGILGSGTLLVQGNFIGTDETATLELGNFSTGIQAGYGLTIGGTGAGEGNVIAHNGGKVGFGLSHPGGIFVDFNAQQVTIRGNSIFDNQPLGIDLIDGNLNPGVTPNDPCDTDTGANGLQNYPMITSVVPGATTTHIEGLLNSTGSTTFDIDLYSVGCARRPQDYFQGETYLGSLQVTTDGSCNATFATDVPFVLEAGQPVTATATDPSGNTSEFSQRILFSMAPSSGGAVGGLGSFLAGMLFEPGATVTVGGVPSPNVSFVDSTTISVDIPARPAGSANDVTVLDPSGLTGTLRNGWVADFLDVPEAQQFHDFVVKLFVNEVTAGVGGGNYGVNDPTLREQMAVFLLKSEHGVCYAPPPCTGIFTDVPCPATPAFPYSDWIEQLFNEGITAGCLPAGNYCPGSPVTRAEMAVFLLKAEHGVAYVPPPCTGIFQDVECAPIPAFAVDWIEQLYFEGITSGCSQNPLRYCPDNPNTRGEMAVFLVKTFRLQ